MGSEDGSGTNAQTLITHVRYIGLAVEDFAAERQFLQDQWCLNEEHGQGDVAYFAGRGSTEQFIVRLRKAEDRRTDLFAFAVDDRADVEQLYKSLQADGIKLANEPAELNSPGGGYGFRFFDLDGRLVEVSADVAERVAEAPIARAAIPQGLSHVVFHTPDVRKAVAWYERHLGMRVSDWLDDFMCFLRGKNAKHHCMAFLAGPPTLNHVAFEMVDADDMMRGLGRMLKHDIRLTWGPGRHTAGDNTFAYFQSPAGNNLEYTAELEYLPDDWQPRTFPRSAEIIDQWGTGRMTGAPTYPPLKPDPALWSDDPLQADMRV